MRHSILHPTFEFNFEGRHANYQQLLHNFTQLIYEVLPAIEQLLDKFAIPQHTISIDLISLDLGNIPLKELPSEFKQRLIRALSDALKEALKQHKQKLQNPPYLDESINQVLYDIAITDQQTATLEALNYFLETGRQAWWVNPQPQTNFAKITDLVQYLNQNNPLLLKILIEENYTQPSFRQRLLQQIPLRLLLQIWLDNQESKIIFLQNLWQDLQKINKLTMQMPTSYLKQRFGEKLLELFVVPQTQIKQFNKATIQSYIIQIIAQPLSINEVELLEKIAAKQAIIFDTNTLQTRFEEAKQTFFFKELEKIQVKYAPESIISLQNILQRKLPLFLKNTFFERSLPFINDLQQLIKASFSKKVYAQISIEKLIIEQSLDYWKANILAEMNENKFIQFISKQVFKSLESKLLPIDSLANLEMYAQNTAIITQIEGIINKTKNQKNPNYADFISQIILFKGQGNIQNVIDYVTEKQIQINWNELQNLLKNLKTANNESLKNIKKLEKLAQKIQAIIPQVALNLNFIEAKKVAKSVKENIKITNKVDAKRFQESDLITNLEQLLSTEDSQWLLNLLRKVELQAPILGQNIQNLKPVLWQYITDFLFANQYIDFEKNTFTKGFILFISQKYDISKDLLAEKIQIDLQNSIAKQAQDIAQLWQNATRLEVILSYFSTNKIINFLAQKFPQEIKNLLDYSTILIPQDLLTAQKSIIQIAWQEKQSAKPFAELTNVRQKLGLMIQNKVIKQGIKIAIKNTQAQDILAIWHSSKLSLEKTLAQINLQLGIDINPEDLNTENNIDKLLGVLAPLQITWLRRLIAESLEHLAIVNPSIDNILPKIRLSLKYFLIEKMFLSRKIGGLNDKTISFQVYSFLNQRYQIQPENYKIINENRRYIYDYMQEKQQEISYYFYVVDYFLETSELLWVEQVRHLIRKKNILIAENKEKRVESLLIYLLRENEIGLKNIIQEHKERLKYDAKFWQIIDNFKDKKLKKLIQNIVKKADNTQLAKPILSYQTPNEWLEMIAIYLQTDKEIAPISEVLALLYAEALPLISLYFTQISAQDITKLSAKNTDIVAKIQQENNNFQVEIMQLKEDIKQKKYVPLRQKKLTDAEQKQALQKIKQALEKSKKRLKEWNEEPMYIQNAGLVILNPFLPRFFEALELTQNNAFKDDLAIQKAIYLMEYLVRKTTDLEETSLYLNKILCGVELQEVVFTEIEITEKEQELCESLLQAVIQYWSIMKGSTSDALRGSYLIRNGQITDTPDGYVLKVEQKTLDVLLEQLPWSIAFIRFPWMKKALQVEWF